MELRANRRHLLAGIAFSLPAQLMAQTAPAPAPVTPPAAAAQATDGRKIYLPADFARFSPRNALDMVRQVPGFTIIAATNVRGLGQASENVLLNGQRVASKTGGAAAELQKISAPNVVRIEIVQAATLGFAGLTGEVANVVTNALKRSSGQFSWTPEFRAHYADPIYTRGDISYSSGIGKVAYTLAINSDGGRGSAGGPTTIFGADGQPTEYRTDAWRNNFDSPKATARFVLDGPGTSEGNLSIAYTVPRSTYHEVSDRDRLTDVDRQRTSISTSKGDNIEITGDYAFPLAGGSMELIGLYREVTEPSLSTSITTYADASPSTGDRVRRNGKSGERIGRLEYSWKWGQSNFELSGEAAFNSLSSVTHLFSLQSNGDFAEISFPSGSGQVTEDRFEILATYGQSLTSTLSLQLVGGGEYSKLAAVGQTRRFYRPKGSAILAWTPDKANDISLRLRRNVAQLNFYDFLASVSLVQEIANAGNANLVPQQSWQIDLEAGHKLGPWGNVRVRLFARLIEDLNDIIPIGATGESLGNIDKARRYGVELKSTLLLDPLGWHGAKVDSSVFLQGSRVRDPLTGQQRAISSDPLRSINIALRHDIPKSQLAWGASLFHNWNAFSYRLTEFSRNWEGPLWIGGFVEHKNIFGLTVRASFNNIANARSRLDRTVYSGRRTDPINFIEKRNRLIGPIFSFSVRGNF